MGAGVLIKRLLYIKWAILTGSSTSTSGQVLLQSRYSSIRRMKSSLQCVRRGLYASPVGQLVVDVTFTDRAETQLQSCFAGRNVISHVIKPSVAGLARDKSLNYSFHQN